jgi:hypothetical protein
MKRGKLQRRRKVGCGTRFPEPLGLSQRPAAVSCESDWRGTLDDVGPTASALKCGADTHRNLRWDKPSGSGIFADAGSIGHERKC